MKCPLPSELKHILIVDDNASAREIFVSMLKSLKFDVTAAESGTEAIRQLERAQQERKPYSLVLMDWKMPGMDGLETIKQMRSNNDLSMIPAFIMITAYNRDELLQEASDIHIDGILVKPVSPSTLLDTIMSKFGKKITVRPHKERKKVDFREIQKSLSGIYVLLVEDNDVNQELALEILKGAGIRVDVAQDGVEALEKIKLETYDAVLMDCQMPVMDGFEATRKLRQDGSYDILPVIAMTANAMVGDRQKCIDSGMNDHIAKPIDVGQLFTTLARWVKPKTYSDANSEIVPISVTNGMPDIVGLDIKTALRRVGGNVSLLKKLLSRFVETQSEVIYKIKMALNNGDTDTAIREAHTVRGLAGNIGADEMFNIAANVERIITDGHSDDLPQALEKMEYTLGELLAKISTSLPKDNPDKTASFINDAVDISALAEEIKGLAKLLTDDDSRAIGLIDSTIDKLISIGYETPAKQLQLFVSRFEFEAALDKLKEVAHAMQIRL